MATIEVSLREEEPSPDEGRMANWELRDCLELQVREVEMIEYLELAPEEWTEEREGYRNYHYTRSEVTGIVLLRLWVPHSCGGTFSTKMFAGYQRFEIGLVLALM
jgi:transposase-like protein